MQQFMKKVARVLAIVARIALWVSGTGLVLMTAFIAWQVWGRFVLNDTPTWTESSAVIIMGWFIFLGAAVGIREGYHLSFDVLLYILPDRVKKILYSVSDITVVAFGIGMMYYGYLLAEKTWPSTIPNLGFSGGIAFLSLIFGGFLMVIFSLERLARRACGLVTARFGETELPEEDL
ncbi:TRAP transporter small permease [Celeribacter arenosi]|uniref:TRAP transporter small permease protein n=2 Tax=Celeribacter arenosi TaxID=792649 RepID=A0ABP7KDN6_9RHOB